MSQITDTVSILGRANDILLEGARSIVPTNSLVEANAVKAFEASH